MEEAAERIDTLQAIELAEGVEVRLRIAGPLLRGMALGIDVVIQMLGLGLLAALLGLAGLAGLAMGGMVAAGMIQLAWFFVWWWYGVLFEAGKWGATPGKKMLGLRVVQTSGAPVTFSQALVRNFLRVADGMPCFGGVIMGVPTMGFGLACCLATRRFQRLGDLAAGTVVIYDKVLPEPAVPAPPPMDVARPAVSLRPEEVRAVVAFRERSGLWSEGRRSEIADHAAELTGATGQAGVSRIMAIAHWLQEKR
jgi:uncharacterized RDD family membrane protein YckC